MAGKGRGRGVRPASSRFTTENRAMTIGKKFLMANAVAAVLTLSVAASGYWGLDSVYGSVRQMLRSEAQVAERAAIVRATVLGLRRYEKDILINMADAKKVDEYVV